MAGGRWIFFLLALAMITSLAGCSGGSTANVQNPKSPGQTQIAIAFQPAPAASVAVGFTENVTAVVSNDSTNAGVDWSVVCPSSVAVQIAAFATASNDAANVVASISVTAFNSSLPAGTYVLQAQGVDSSLSPYQIAAALVLDGNGNIERGEQTANYAATGSLSDSNLTGTYFVGSDGRGTITIDTNDNNIGTNGVETFAFVYLSSSQALISQIDLASANTGVSATGTLDLQSATAEPAGGYAFVVSGTNVVRSLPVAFGGVLNIDSPNTISGKGSVTDEILGAKVNATAAAISGTLTPPDQFGAVTFHLQAGYGAANKAVSLQFTGYIVDDAHLKLIETDTASGNTAPFGLTAGTAIAQGTATGTFTGNAAFSGTYVFGITGVDLSNSNLAPATLNSFGIFDADGNGNFERGYTDTFLDLNTIQGTGANPQTGAQISAPFTGTYSVDSTGTGRAASTSIALNPEPKHGYQPAFFFYLSGNGNPPLVLAGGDTHYPSVGAGIAYPQSTAAPVFSGDYGLSFTQEVSGASENDGTAQFNVNATAQTLTGFADSSVNSGFSSLPDQSFGGAYNPPSASIPFPGTLENVNQSSAFTVGNTTNSGFPVNYYFIDAGHGFFVETDLVNPSPGSGQVSFGYYAARTPVCNGCP